MDFVKRAVAVAAPRTRIGQPRCQADCGIVRRRARRTRPHDCRRTRMRRPRSCTRATSMPR